MPADREFASSRPVARAIEKVAIRVRPRVREAQMPGRAVGGQPRLPRGGSQIARAFEGEGLHGGGIHVKAEAARGLRGVGEHQRPARAARRGVQRELRRGPSIRNSAINRVARHEDVVKGHIAWVTRVRSQHGRWNLDGRDRAV